MNEDTLAGRHDVTGAEVAEAEAAPLTDEQITGRARAALLAASAFSHGCATSKEAKEPPWGCVECSRSFLRHMRLAIEGAA